MAELPVLPIAECVDISILHQHNCTRKQSQLFTCSSKQMEVILIWGTEMNLPE